MKNISTNTRSLPRYSAGLFALIMVFGIQVLTQEARGQSSYKIMEGTQIKVSGTSNLHDWTMMAKSFVCEGKFVTKGGVLQDVSSLSFSLPVTNLKSKEDLMDTRAHKTLKASKFDKITFKLIEATVVPKQKVINAIGNLTIGGVTNKVSLQTTYLINADETITCKGSKMVKMSDFNIKAPSFMLGALKTGNDVTIDLLLKFKN